VYGVGVKSDGSRRFSTRSGAIEDVVEEVVEEGAVVVAFTVGDLERLRLDCRTRAVSMQGNSDTAKEVDSDTAR